jgi:hypothetical protein
MPESNLAKAEKERERDPHPLDLPSGKVIIFTLVISPAIARQPLYLFSLTQSSFTGEPESNLPQSPKNSRRVSSVVFQERFLTKT